MTSLTILIYQDFNPLITYGIILFTVVFSFWAFNREDRLSKYSFMPYQIKHYRQHYRFLSHAFIHADELHLIFNMLGLYFFGQHVEFNFLADERFGQSGGVAIYILFYSTAIYAAVLPQQIKLKNDSGYASLGASGAVNAIVFAYILLEPTASLGLFFIPFRISAWIFGIGYLVISYILTKRKSNNPMAGMINHEAHLWGALYGILFMAIVKPGIFVNFYHTILGR